MKKFSNFRKSAKKANVLIIIIVVFGIYITFSAENNYMKIVEYKNEIRELERKKKAAEDTFRLYKQKLDQLETDPETLERIVREEYRMKRDNEDVYIVKEK